MIFDLSSIHHNNTYTGSIQYRGQSLGMPQDIDYYGSD